MTIDALSLGMATSTAVAADTDTFRDEFWPLFLAAFNMAHRMLGDRAAAEDVAAEAMARAHLDWRRVGGLPHRRAWVLRVAANRAIDVLRRAPMPPPSAAGTASFEDALATRLTLARALDRLPRRQREAVVLRYVAGLSLEETASTLGISPTSVRTHVRRALGALRAVLGDLPDKESLDVPE